MIPLAALLCLICIAGAIYFGAAVFRTANGDGLATLPVDRASEITLDAAGEVVIEIETPRLSQEYQRFEVVIEAGSGEVNRFKYPFNPLRSESYGVTTMRVEFGRMFAAAGKYRVHVDHLAMGVDHSNVRLILSRPYKGRLAAQIVGLALCAIGTLGSVIWAVWLAGWMKQSG